MAKLKKFAVGVYWEMYGFHYVKARTKAEAIKKTQLLIDDPHEPLPENGEYSDATAKIDPKGVWEVKKDGK